MGGGYSISVPLQFISQQWKAEIDGTLPSSAPRCQREKGSRDHSWERETQVKAALTLLGASMHGSCRLCEAVRC